MAQFQHSMLVSRPITEVFDFFRHPANLVRLSPPELNLRLLDGPEQLELGSRITLLGHRWGVPLRLVSEVTALEPPTLLIDEQREGPFRQWIHTHRFEETAEGTQLIDLIDFEPPAGLLGMLLPAARIESDLRQAFEHRRRTLEEVFGKADAGEA